MIAYTCPACQASLDAHDGEAGSKHDCPKCGQRLQVPLSGAPNRTVLATREPARPAPKAAPAEKPAAAAPSRGAPAWVFLLAGILIGAGLMAGGMYLGAMLWTR